MNSIECTVVHRKENDKIKYGIIVCENDLNKYLEMDEPMYFILENTLGNRLPISYGEKIKITVEKI